MSYNLYEHMDMINPPDPKAAVALIAMQAAQIAELEKQQRKWLAANSPNGWIDELRKEVEALKGRIEELEWDNKGIAEWRDEWQRMKEQRDQLCAERNSALAKLAALEGQEPVGYVYWNKGHAEGALSVQTLNKGAPLYLAAGAQAQPLSDEQIVDIAVKECVAEGGTNGYILPISFARAIEKAHKIGGSV